MTAPDDFAAVVLDAARRPEALAAVRNLVARAEEEVGRIRPRCDLSGRCCRFEAYGHRLYITALEMALFAEDLRAAPGSLPGGGARDPGGCPFQREKLCGVHPIRPLGCRMFFCDPAAAPALEEAFGRLHGELKRLHEELGVPYRYVEWREALAAIAHPLNILSHRGPATQTSEVSDQASAVSVRGAGEQETHQLGEHGTRNPS